MQALAAAPATYRLLSGAVARSSQPFRADQALYQAMTMVATVCCGLELLVDRAMRNLNAEDEKGQDVISNLVSLAPLESVESDPHFILHYTMPGARYHTVATNSD